MMKFFKTKKIFLGLLVIVVLSACTGELPAATAEPTITMTMPVPTDTVSPTKTTQPSETPISVTITSIPTETPLPTTTMIPTNVSTTAIVIDHRAVALFESIPEFYLEKARNTKLLFSDRSVGANISQGLDCLAVSTDWSSVPANCRRGYVDKSGTTWTWKTYTAQDLSNGIVPAGIYYDPDPIIYDRSNWYFDLRMGEWEQLIGDFVNQLVEPNIDSYEIFSFQFNYFSVAEGSNITDAESGFFVDQPHQGYYPNRPRWDISDLEDLEKKYPEKLFFYWTTSLARSVGSQESEDFNQMMREYAVSNGKVLFDFADIISHTPESGEPCYDNRDGIEYCSQNGDCENYADDGLDTPAICQDYTTEIDGGHLGSVASGKIRAAKAFWVMMAVLNGWDGLEQLQP